jgi:hypothetical protein
MHSDADETTMKTPIAVILATFLLVGCALEVTEPRLNGQIDALEISDDLTAYLFMEPGALKFGDSLDVRLEVRNHGDAERQLTTYGQPPASIVTLREDEPVLLVGGTNPQLGMVSTFPISPGESLVQQWRLQAVRHQPRGEPPPLGTYDVRVKLDVYEIDGHPVRGRYTLGGSFRIEQ